MYTKIIKLSKEGKFPKEISKILGIKYHTVLKIFKDNNLQLQGSGASYKKKVTYNPFLKEEGNYWAGFLAADGCLSKKNYSIYLRIKDLDHIEKYKIFINSDLKIYYNKNKANSIMGCITFRSKENWDYLNSIGITPKKSLTFQFKNELNWDFIRGYFDGDGSISKNEPKITTGSNLFKEQLIKFFKDNNLTYSVSIKGNTFDVYIRGNSRKDFFFLMYYRENLTKLDRKYTAYRAALEKFKVKNIG